MSYRINYTDGTTVEVKTGIPDALRWEANHKGESLGQGIRTYTGMLTLVWYALRRQGLSDAKDFQGWAASVADYAVLTDDENPESGVDPTNPDHSDE